MEASTLGFAPEQCGLNVSAEGFVLVIFPLREPLMPNPDLLRGPVSGTVSSSNFRRRIVLGFLLAIALAAATLGIWHWFDLREPQASSEIFQGVWYSCERLPPSKQGKGLIHCVRVDLSAPGIDLYVTPLDASAAEAGWQYRLRQVGDVVAREDLAVGINGTLFTSDSWLIQWSGDRARSVETVVSDHRVSHLWEHTYLLGFDDQLRPQLKPSKPPTSAELARARWGIGGQGIGLRDGKVGDGNSEVPNSRTAIAIDADRKLLFLAAAEWVSPHLILESLAAQGAKEGMLLDGGGSTTMAIGARARDIRPGVLLGGWRPVATSFGVRAKAIAPESR
jgi:Phosphodiester glycosidase